MNMPAQPKRIGYIVKMFPRISETFILNEILEVERQGAEVVIFSAKKPNEGRFHPQLAELKARVYYLDELDLKKWSTWISGHWSILAPFQPRLWEAVGTALQEGDVARVDLIWQAAWIAAQAQVQGIEHLHAHFASLPSTLAHLAHQVSGIPFSFTAHAKDIYVYTNNEHYLNEKMISAGRVVTVTNFNRAYLERTYPHVPSNRVEVIHNGIDLNLFKADPSVSRKADHILAVGRLVPKKGLDVLLSALARLKSDGVPFHCRIVGDGSERAALESQRSVLGLDEEVQFCGALHRDQVLDLMKSATVMALPCVVAEDGNVDALPTVLLEALACGLPVVSTRVSGIPEIVDHDTNGFLCEPNDPPALAACLKELLSDPARRDQLATAGRMKAETHFDLERNVARLRQVFAESASAGPAVVPGESIPALMEARDVS
jgi:colanic acid/amylovoran biosynthesis glycosyltransferase